MDETRFPAPETAPETIPAPDGAAPEEAAVTEAAVPAPEETAAEETLAAGQAAAPEETQQDGAPDTASAMVTVTDVCFRPGGKVYFFDPRELTLRAGDHVIISTARGNEFGYVSAGNHTVPVSQLVSELRPVVRLATETDEQIAAANRELERDACNICQQKIEQLGLEMQLVSAEVAFDGSKIIFFFTADGRVDFRELVKNLASVFRTRIELRQIGVRDKAKMVGGLGICGRPFCCGEFLDDFQPVSIKMAKTQNLSLNPTKISGACGRLMCCLKYEQEAYEDLLKTSPKAESFVDTPEGRGTVTEVNLLRESVKVRMEKAPDEVHCFQNCEICVLRNGKAKKTDPPIPPDLAPISGGKPKPRRKLTQSLEDEPIPEVRLFGETINARPLSAASGETRAEGEKPHSGSRRRRGGRGRGKGAKNSAEAAGTGAPAQQKPTRPAASEPRPQQPQNQPGTQNAQGGQSGQGGQGAQGSAQGTHRRRRRGGRGRGKGSKPAGESAPPAPEA